MQINKGIEIKKKMATFSSDLIPNKSCVNCIISQNIHPFLFLVQNDHQKSSNDNQLLID